jgi:two-component system CAI-1 autoinducer sensor kinase/phosphatase CqsS
MEHRNSKDQMKLAEDFAGFIAHEMRKPLASLLIYLGVIAKAEKIPDPQERTDKINFCINKSKQVVLDANYLIESVLIKLRRLATDLNPNDLSTCDILTDLTKALRKYPFAKAERKLVTLDDKNAFGYLGDSALTVHVIYNLLNNALKIIKEAGKGEITISFNQTQAANELIFKDTAKGINQEFLPSIFDTFVTKDKTKKGTGLGLAFCQSVMQAYGGEIKCESQVNEYTKFVLTFPKLAFDKI